MAQDEVLRLIAKAQDDASPVFKKLRETMKALRDGAEGPKESTKHLKVMHGEAVRGAVEMKRHYRELREHLDKVTDAVSEKMEPAFGALGLKSAAATLSVAALAEAVKSFAERGADLEAFARKARVSVDTLRGMEGAADIFHVDKGEVDANLKTLTDAMYAFRRHRGEFYAYLKAQRPEDADALAMTPDSVEGNEKALRIWLQMLEKIKATRGEAAARAFSRERMGSESFVDMLRDGTAGLDKAIADYNRAAGKMDTKKSQDFMEQLTRFKQAAEGLKNSLGNTLLPEFTADVGKLTDAVKEYGPGFAKGLTDTIHAVEDGVKEAWPVIKNAVDEMDPYVQKIGGWKTVFEALAVVKLTSFAAEVTGLASSVRILTAAIDLLPAGARVALGFAGAVAAGASAQSTPGDGGISADATERQKQIDENRRLTDEANKRLRQGPYAPSAGEVSSQFQKQRQNINPLFHHSAFGEDLLSAHSAFEEAIARGTAAGVLKAFADYASMSAMNAGGGGSGGLIKASWGGRGGAGGSFDASPFRLSKKGNAEAGEHAEFIKRAAAALGIDPNYALKVAASEGLYASHAGGDKGTSFGDFQMHYGGSGIRGMNAGGLGDMFNKATGLDGKDPKNWRMLDLFALMQARKGGWSPWHGAARVGIRGYDGINRGAPLPAPGDLAGKLGGAGQGSGGGVSPAPATLHVKVDAPRGTKVAASGGSLFKTVNLNRGYSMTPASEVA